MDSIFGRIKNTIRNAFRSGKQAKHQDAQERHEHRYFDNYSQAADFARKQAARHNKYFSLIREGDGWLVFESDTPESSKNPDSGSTAPSDDKRGDTETSRRQSGAKPESPSNQKAPPQKESTHGGNETNRNNNDNVVTDSNKVNWSKYPHKVLRQKLAIEILKFHHLPTEELELIWKTRNSGDYSERECEAIRIVLRERKGLNIEPAHLQACPVCFLVGNACICHESDSIS